MNIFVSLDKDGFANGWGSSAVSDDSIEIDIPDEHPFFLNMMAHKLVEGEFVFDEERNNLNIQKENVELNKQQGIMTEESVSQKMLEIGFEALDYFEQDLLIDRIAETLQKESIDVTNEDILNYWKQKKGLFFKEYCERKIEEGFTASNGHFYRTNRDDQTNMIGQKDMLGDSPGTLNVPWKTEDVGYIMHTREVWLSIYQEAFAHKQNQLFRYDNIRKEVAAAIDFTTLHAIVW